MFEEKKISMYNRFISTIINQNISIYLHPRRRRLRRRGGVRAVIPASALTESLQGRVRATRTYGILLQNYKIYLYRLILCLNLVELLEETKFQKCEHLFILYECYE